MAALSLWHEALESEKQAECVADEGAYRGEPK